MPTQTFTNTVLVPSATTTLTLVLPSATVSNTPNPAFSSTNTPVIVASATNTPVLVPSATSTPLVPTIISLSVNAGPAEGGRRITITGTNFEAGTTVWFNGVALQSTAFVNSTTLTGWTPMLSPGMANVSVQNPSSGMTSVLPSAYEAQASPDGPNAILEHGAAPNPVGLAGGALMVNLAGRADEIHLKIYTKSMIAISDVVAAGPFAAGWNTIPYPASFIANAENGLYYYVVKSYRNGGAGVAPPTGKLFILK